MNLHLLSSSDFQITTISRHDSDIRHHPLLKKRQVDADKLHELLDDNFCLLHALNLPIFFKQENQYLLIARRWILDYVIDHKIDVIHMIFFQNEDWIPEVLKLDELESQLLPKKRLVLKLHRKEKAPSKHEHTNDRRRARKTGRICPFCKGPLFKENKIRPDTPVGYQRIACDNKSNEFYDHCPFTALLTDNEFNKFQDFELNTNEWLQSLPDSVSKCGQPVYRRIIRHDKGPKRQVDLCKNYFQYPEGVCDYQP